MSKATILLVEHAHYTEIKGLVDGKEVISISDHILREGGAVWKVGGSYCLPSDPDRARAFVTAMSMAFEKLDDIIR